MDVINKLIDKLKVKKCNIEKSILDKTLVNEDIVNKYEYKPLECSVYIFKYNGNWYKLSSNGSNTYNWIYNYHVDLAKSIIDRIYDGDETLKRSWTSSENGSFMVGLSSSYDNHVIIKLSKDFSLDTVKEFSYKGKLYSLDYYGDDIQWKKVTGIIYPRSISDKIIDLLIALYPELKDGIYSIPKIGYNLILKCKGTYEKIKEER